MSTLIIAEAGVNHNGDMELAKKLVDVAHEAKVDVVKFQTFIAKNLVTKTAEKAEYQNKFSPESEFQFEMLQKLELTEKQHKELKKLANSKGLEFLSTGFDIESMEMLISLGVNRLKIPSGEITNLPYLRFIAAQKKEIILSTGMSTLKEIDSALTTLVDGGAKLEDITVLHCTTNYPAQMNEVNLKAMVSIGSEFKVKTGYSDHTVGIEVAIAAVALGATVIEKHFTLDRNLPGSDHRSSLEPTELTALVQSIRNIEIAMGDGVKRPMEAELANRNAARKSLVASREIAKGELFTLENVSVKRPGSGISPMEWDSIIGTVASKDFSEDDLITQ
ncbi:N,N'-diacetyllegionaminate synthase [Candidatus Planktophila dulcis]|uniref:N,N'-diacetyllegionaminate synthase n=1 Tax=Candidatus Planktophila dulcis TaxID=1884914 RepID=A0AAD0E552_9ACTN|nr:N-acetylneuraminate synthase [Candidatus Planktophila dulcis]ASY11436.1 N,N'-diacetyllegionaminate synthase [Candidatus Planktophila dulcis]